MTAAMSKARGRKKNQDLLTGHHAHSARTELLQLPRGASEADIQDRIAAWLRSENIDYQLQYRTQSGPIDIHLKHLRCIIEVKRRGRLEGRYGKAGGRSYGPTAPGSGSARSGGSESALDQVSRYIDSLRVYGSLDEGPGWRGVVTDGKQWWIWEWSDDKPGTNAVIVPGWDGRLLDMSTMESLRDEIARDGAAVPWAPDDPTDLFEPFIKSVRDVYNRHKPLPNTAIQKKLWLEQLKGGGRYPKPSDEDDLFVRHTLLILIARMVSGTRLGAKTNKRRMAVTSDRLLEGFVGWMSNAPSILDQLQSTIDRYDWQANQTDVMRTLYMGFIPIEHRRSYGEYYTPDWVAEKICLEVIDDRYITRQIRRFTNGEDVERVLDPACGSGTFLQHAGIRIRNSNPVRNARMKGRKLDEFIAGIVWGIDLHPVAVEMAVANMARMLHGIDPQRLHVYQGDSMLADTPTATLDGATGNSITLRSDGETLTLPRRFVGGRPDGITAFVSSAVAGSRLPPPLLNGLNSDEQDVMKRAHKAMTYIVERNGNGVWGWYIRNQSAPMLLADDGNIGRIVSNAPWVRFSEIKDKVRQKKIEDLSKETGVYVGDKMKTSLDISAVFVARCNSMYLVKNGRAGWVMPVTAIKGAGQWERLRTKYTGLIKAFWNLGTLPFPKQGQCCTLLYSNGGARKTPPSVLRLVCNGPRPDDHDGWVGVVSKIARLDGGNENGQVSKPVLTSKTSKPSAWLTGIKKPNPIARQGATILPNMLVRIRGGSDYVNKIRSKCGSGSGKEMVQVETEVSTKGVWRHLGTRNAIVPRSWLHNVIRGGDILPFTIPLPTLHIIPIDKDGKWLANRNKNAYWKDACSLYGANCGSGVHTPKTLEEQLDYHGKLSSQFPSNDWTVVYNKSGKRLYAAIANKGYIVPDTTYRVTCQSQAEANFLTAILNSDAIQCALCETQRSTRDYHTYFWRSIPIPRYDRDNTVHNTLSLLGAKARKEAASIYRQRKSGEKVTRQKVVAGLQSSGLARKIDNAVKNVLPAYVVMKHGLDVQGSSAASRRRRIGERDKRQQRLTS